MSNYKNFIDDYPSRCAKILEMYFIGAKQNNLEVTLLLNIASSGLIVPFERLKTGTPDRPYRHPLGDADRYMDAKKRLDDALGQTFLGSELHPADTPGSWNIGRLRDIAGETDSWDWEELKQVANKKQAKRNSEDTSERSCAREHRHSWAATDNGTRLSINDRSRKT